MISPPADLDWSNNYGYAWMDEAVRDSGLAAGSDVTLSVTPEDVAAMSSPVDVLHSWKIAATVHNLNARVEGPEEFLALDQWGMTAPEAATSEPAAAEESETPPDPGAGGIAPSAPAAGTGESPAPETSGGADAEAGEPSADSETPETTPDDATPPTTDSPPEAVSESAPSFVDQVISLLEQLNVIVRAQKS